MAADDYKNDIERFLTRGSEVAGGATDVLASVGVSQGREATEQLSKQIAELVRIAQQQVETTRANTLAIESTARAGQATGLGADLAKSAGSYLLKGLTLGPLIGGIAKLFGGGDNKSAEPRLESFALPEPIRAEAGLSSSGNLYSIARGSGDQPRVIAPMLTAEEPRGQVMANGGSGAIQNITVNISAMDSKSFMDRSDDIARAVREAMLNSHSLNDVVNDL